jgi:hypothetical protein
VVPELRRWLAGLACAALRGNETDIAHVLLALAQGLAAQEIAGWLGTSPASVQRRWDLAIRAVLDGLTPAPDDGITGV